MRKNVPYCQAASMQHAAARLFQNAHGQHLADLCYKQNLSKNGQMTTPQFYQRTESATISGSRASENCEDGVATQ